VNKYNQECIKLRTFVAVTFCCKFDVARMIFRKSLKNIKFIKLMCRMTVAWLLHDCCRFVF